MGRFLQTDPIRFYGKDGNLYRYGFNTVSTLADPFGLVCVCDGPNQWHWESDTKYPDSSIAGNTPADQANYANAELEHVMYGVQGEGKPGCVSCDQNGIPHLDQKCADKNRNCTLVNRLKYIGFLPDDYPIPDYCND